MPEGQPAVVPNSPGTGTSRHLDHWLTALKRRNRIVVFRLTEDEYEFLRGACHTAGGRNLSDFTRSEVLTRLASASEIAKFSALDQRLEEMQALLQSVLALLETTVRL